MDWAEAFVWVGCTWAVAAVAITFFDSRKNQYHVCRFKEAKPVPVQLSPQVKRNV